MSAESLRTPEPLRTLAGLTDEAWLVGGAVRDELLGRPTQDYDVAVSGDARRLALALRRSTGGHAFALSDEFGAWRVIDRDRRWQVDLMPLMGPTLADDLARRDLTVNAIARSLASGDLIDPYDGRGDLGARRLRMVAPESFTADPLRVIRLARLSCDLGFEVEKGTSAAAAAAAPGLHDVSVERVFTELRLIVTCPAAPEGLRTMESLGATAVVLPELSTLHGIDQSQYHHLDAYDHTIEVLERAIELERDPEALFPGSGDAIAAFLAEPLASELTRAHGLRFGALFHDIAKAQTRAVTTQGRVTFIGHDAEGAQTAITVLGRLRAGERLAAHVAALTRHHLRLGFLVHEMPLDRHAVYRYLRACEPVEVDVTLLSVADRLATRGRNADRAIELHLTLAREMLPEALRWHGARPRPPVRGDRLAAALGIRPGPEVGRLLEELTEAAFAGEVSSEADALAWARGR